MFQVKRQRGEGADFGIRSEEMRRDCIRHLLTRCSGVCSQRDVAAAEPLHNIHCLAVVAAAGRAARRYPAHALRGHQNLYPHVPKHRLRRRDLAGEVGLAGASLSVACYERLELGEDGARGEESESRMMSNRQKGRSLLCPDAPHVCTCGYLRAELVRAGVCESKRV